jgi:GTP-binding protein HflX
MKVLGEIGAESTAQVLVLNKADRLPQPDRQLDLPTLTHRLLGETARQNETEAALVSAQSGDGIPRLLELIDKHLVQDPVVRARFRFPLGEGRALNLLHDRAAVLSQVYHDTYCEVIADTPQSVRDRLTEFVTDNPA